MLYFSYVYYEVYKKMETLFLLPSELHALEKRRRKITFTVLAIIILVNNGLYRKYFFTVEPNKTNQSIIFAFDVYVLIFPPILVSTLLAKALYEIIKLSAQQNNLLAKEKMIGFHLLFFSLYTIS